MKRTYTCPHCHGVLNPGTKIVLRGQRGKSRALILLSPQPGNYDAILPEGFSLKARDRVDFSCPLCDADLASARDGALAEIAFRAGDLQGTVAFSRLFGQHSTYFITEESVKAYGEHASSETVNFFGAGPEE